jgi:hypothetical protein
MCCNVFTRFLQIFPHLLFSNAVAFLVGKSNFHISIIDNAHSRAAGLVGLYGVLGTNSQEIIVRDPCTGDLKVYWHWYEFHQFHFQSPAHPVDDKRIIVMHTSR